MVKFLVCGNVKPPKRNKGDAGVDLFVPEYSDEFKITLMKENNVWDPFDNEEGIRTDITIKTDKITLAPGADIKIPTFVRALIPENECLRFSNKSGVALKQKLVVGAEIIDSSYEGIMNIHVFNVSNESTSIMYGQKCVQAVPILIDTDEINIQNEEDVSVEEFYKDHDHSRGTGGFGSTGLK